MLLPGWWCTSVIPATGEMKIGKITVQGHFIFPLKWQKSRTKTTATTTHGVTWIHKYSHHSLLLGTEWHHLGR
jgi:hypothetical protein